MTWWKVQRPGEAAIYWDHSRANDPRRDGRPSPEDMAKVILSIAVIHPRSVSVERTEPPKNPMPIGRSVYGCELFAEGFGR